MAGLLDRFPKTSEGSGKLLDSFPTVETESSEDITTGNRELILKDFLAAPTFDQSVSNATQSLLDGIVNAPGVIGRGIGTSVKGFTDPEVQRAAGRVAGGITGSAIGSPVGPAGAVAGGILGSAAGGQVVGGLQGFFGTSDLEEGGLLKETATEMLFDLGVSGVATLARKGLLKTGFAKIMGVANDHAKEMSRLGRATDVPVGIADVTESSIIQGAQRVLGVFPFVGGPFVQHGMKQREALKKGLTGTLDTLAPWTLYSEAGVNLIESARRNYARFGGLSETAFNHARTLARGLTDTNIVPTSNLSRAIDIAEEMRVRVLKKGGDPAKAKLGKGFKAIFDYIEELKEVSERGNISLDEAYEINKTISDMFDTKGLAGRAARAATIVRKGVDLSIANMTQGSNSPDAFRNVKTAYQRANDFFAENIIHTQTSTANKLKQFDANLFKTGAEKALSRPSDESINAIFRTKSPQALEELRPLVGKDAFEKASRAYIEDGLSESFTRLKGRDGVIFNPKTLVDHLNVGRDESFVREAFKTNKAAGENFLKLIKIAENRGEMHFPSTFVARRLVLGGVRSAKLALVAGAIGTSTVAGAAVSPIGIASMLLLRRGASLLTSPKALKALVDIQQETPVSFQQKLAAFNFLEEWLTTD